MKDCFISSQYSFIAYSVKQYQPALSLRYFIYSYMLNCTISKITDVEKLNSYDFFNLFYNVLSRVGLASIVYS